MTITSTYRLQLRGDGFTFADAIAIVDYLDELGVSHLYLSPILTATEGSSHGYDVTDPTTVSATLGGSSGLAALAEVVKQRGMGLVVDIVPNHLGIEQPAQNPWWWDVLTYGQDSRYANYFDIDWLPDNGVDGKLALPILGSDEDAHKLELDVSGTVPLLAYYEHRFPIRPGTGGGTARDIHERQAYRLVNWGSGLVGYRRFFSVNGLAAVRQEDPAVFDATHVQLRDWFAADLVDGIRVDHPDGLADPVGYLDRLRELMGADRWLVIEKILATDEALDGTLPVDGTTGYDALRELGGVFVDPNGEPELSELSAEWTGSPGDEDDLLLAEHQLKLQVSQGDLSPEVRRLVRAIIRDTGTSLDPERIAYAVRTLVAAVGVYRADYSSLAGLTPNVLAHVEAEEPELGSAFDAVAAAIIARGEAAARFAQVCGAVTAKAVEDCLYYRTARLISLQEVGGDPGRFGVTTAEFHTAQAERARWWPRAMTTLSTHDTKRGEDVRARIGVLSQVPELWSRCLEAWDVEAPSPDGAAGLFLWQTLFGVWPASGSVTPELRQRVHAYSEKAVREAGTKTRWNQVDGDFEREVHHWLDTIFDGPVAQSLSALVASLGPYGQSDSLGQKLLQLTGPGIPDVYQGTELWEDSLVDPDNRRLVNFDERRGALRSGESPKLRVVRAALTLRRMRPASFVGGSYAPVLAGGSAAAHLLGFSRGPAHGAADVIALATRWSVALAGTGWGDTHLTLPDGLWTDRISDARHSGTAPAARLFGQSPVALLVREQP